MLLLEGKLAKRDYINVPLRVLNASNTQIELVAGENLADFRPLIELCLSQPRVCGGVWEQNKSTSYFR